MCGSAAAVDEAQPLTERLFAANVGVVLGLLVVRDHVTLPRLATRRSCAAAACFTEALDGLGVVGYPGAAGGAECVAGLGGVDGVGWGRPVRRWPGAWLGLRSCRRLSGMVESPPQLATKIVFPQG